MSTKPRYQPAFAVIRVDLDSIRRWQTATSGGQLNWAFSVIHVHWSRTVAYEQAARLNAQNGPKGCFYFSQHTRVDVSGGGGSEADSPDQTSTIYVPAEKNGADSFHEVNGLLLGNSDYVLLPGLPYDPNAKLRFALGTTVRCERRTLPGITDSAVLVAVENVPPGP